MVWYVWCSYVSVRIIWVQLGKMITCADSQGPQMVMIIVLAIATYAKVNTIE